MINLEVLQGNEDAIERALELFDNHAKRIRMQRKAMDAKRMHGEVKPFKPGDLVVHESRTTEPFEVPLTTPDGTKIGTATVHYTNGILHVDGLLTDGAGAQLLGIGLTLETLYTPVDDVVTMVANNEANETFPEYDEKTTEIEH